MWIWLHMHKIIFHMTRSNAPMCDIFCFCHPPQEFSDPRGAHAGSRGKRWCDNSQVSPAWSVSMPNTYSENSFVLILPFKNWSSSVVETNSGSQSIKLTFNTLRYYLTNACKRFMLNWTMLSDRGVTSHPLSPQVVVAPIQPRLAMTGRDSWIDNPPPPPLHPRSKVRTQAAAVLNTVW